jgi:hypothetical protein
MEKQGRTLKEFLIAFKEEFLNVVDFLDKKTFHRGELSIIVKNACVSVKANTEEKEMIDGIFGLGSVKVSSDEEENVAQNDDAPFPQTKVEVSPETLGNDGGAGYARTYRSGTSHSSLPVSDDKDNN